MEKSQRKDYLDTISGIFILFMVILHWKEHLSWLNPLALSVEDGDNIIVLLDADTQAKGV